MTEQGKYIYGVINSGENTKLGRIGRQGNKREVYTVPHQDISCVVSDSDALHLDMMEKEELGRYLVNHQGVIEEVMKEHTIIPVKFGTQVRSIAEVNQILQRGYSEFKERLKEFHEKVEFDVVCLWNDLNKIIKMIGEEDKDIGEFKTEIAKKPPEETLQDRIKIGAMIKTAVEKKSEETQNHILDYLKEKAIDFQRHEVMDDRMISNCAFLLDRHKEAEFDRALNKLDQQYNGSINFKCVGPLPPYSFTTMQVKKVDLRQLNDARKLLGFGEETTPEEIKESYRKKTLDCHPDNDPDNLSLAGKFEELTKAYKMLIRFCQGEKCSFSGGKVKEFFLIEAMKI